MIPRSGIIPNPLDIGILKATKPEETCSPLAWIIHQRTSTWFTHAVIFKNEQGDIWSAEPGGILNGNIHKEYQGRDCTIIRPNFKFDPVTVGNWIVKKQETCEGYDYEALIGFLTGITALEDEDRWYCSELAYWCWQDNGYKLTNIDKTFVYPSDLMCNTKFDVVGKI